MALTLFFANEALPCRPALGEIEEEATACRSTRLIYPSYEILLHNYDTYRQFVRDILNYWDFRPYYIDLLQGQSVHRRLSDEPEQPLRE